MKINNKTRQLGQLAINYLASPADSISVHVSKGRMSSNEAYFEVIFLPMLVPLLGWLFGAADLFFLQAAFPWAVLVPTLTTARYGTRYGLLSLTILSSMCMLYAFTFNPAAIGAATQILVGCLMLVLVVGEMIRYWEEKDSEKNRQVSRFRQQATESDQALQLLHISYSQLEEELVNAQQSLAGSLRLLDNSLDRVGSDNRDVRLKVAIGKMQSVLERYGWLESASFHAVDKQLTLKPGVLGSIGDMPSDLSQDDLIREALRSRKAVSLVDTDAQSTSVKTELQAAIPLVDSQNKVWAVMAVGKIIANQQSTQNLNLLALLCGYIANLIRDSRVPETSSEKHLCLEMSTSINIVLNTLKSANLLTVEIENSPQALHYTNYFADKVRGANRIWSLQHENKTTLIILLPIFNQTRFAAFHKSLDGEFTKRFGFNMGSAGIKLHNNHIKGECKVPSLQRYLIKLGKYDHARLIR